MDPIKVDFSQEGNYPGGGEIVIPPEKKGLKIIINIITIKNNIRLPY